jgi:hypothetical protein
LYQTTSSFGKVLESGGDKNRQLYTLNRSWLIGKPFRGACCLRSVELLHRQTICTEVLSCMSANKVPIYLPPAGALWMIKFLPARLRMGEDCWGANRKLENQWDWCDHVGIENVEKFRYSGGIYYLELEPVVQNSYTDGCCKVKYYVTSKIRIWYRSVIMASLIWLVLG